MSTDGASGTGLCRTIERLYQRSPLSLPATVRNSYFRWAIDDEFDEYECPPDPFAVLWVDPDRITGFTGRPYPPYHDKRAQLGSVQGGDWDRRKEPPIVDESYRERYELYRADRFSESVFYRSLQSHFEDGVDWERTPFIDRCLELADRDMASWRSLTSAQAIRDRCRRIDELYETIRDEGYRSQRALGNSSLLSVTDEIVVDIARDGTLLFVNGRHRLAIAKLLGLSAVPVGVLVRHADWMATRAAYARGMERPPHPDLRDLQRESELADSGLDRRDRRSHPNL